MSKGVCRRERHAKANAEGAPFVVSNFVEQILYNANIAGPSRVS
jgi:hypothetical protein